MEAYEGNRDGTNDTPWNVAPEDRKWFTRVIVAAAVIDALASLDLRYPEVGAEARGTGRSEGDAPRRQVAAVEEIFLLSQFAIPGRPKDAYG